MTLESLDNKPIDLGVKLPSFVVDAEETMLAPVVEFSTATNKASSAFAGNNG